MSANRPNKRPFLLVISGFTLAILFFALAFTYMLGLREPNGRAVSASKLYVGDHPVQVATSSNDGNMYMLVKASPIGNSSQKELYIYRTLSHAVISGEPCTDCILRITEEDEHKTFSLIP